MGDRVAVLHDGELMQIAPPRAVYEEPANTFVASFVGTPPMNLLTLPVERDVAKGEGVAIAVAHDMGDTITIGFRPEHVALTEGEGGARIEAEVVAIEPLGPETLVYLRAGALDLRARIAGFGGPKPGSAVTAHVPAEHLLYFDAGSGARIEVDR